MALVTGVVVSFVGSLLIGLIALRRRRDMRFGAGAPSGGCRG